MGPLQSFADIPFLLFKPIFPVLATHDLAGSLVSVMAGVGAVHQVHAALSEWGVRRAPRLVLTLLFGINPMVVYYAGNGMSDMLYMFLLVMTTRYFLRWIHGGSLRQLSTRDPPSVWPISIATKRLGPLGWRESSFWSSATGEVRGR